MKPKCHCFDKHESYVEQTVLHVATTQALQLRVAASAGGLCDDAMYYLAVTHFAVMLRSVAADTVGATEGDELEAKVDEILATLRGDVKLRSDLLSEIIKSDDPNRRIQ